jgi:hypothetical protein
MPRPVQAAPRGPGWGGAIVSMPTKKSISREMRVGRAEGLVDLPYLRPPKKDDIQTNHQFVKCKRTSDSVPVIQWPGLARLPAAGQARAKVSRRQRTEMLAHPFWIFQTLLRGLKILISRCCLAGKLSVHFKACIIPSTDADNDRFQNMAGA